LRDRIEMECFNRGLIILGCGANDDSLVAAADFDKENVDVALEIFDAAIALTFRLFDFFDQNRHGFKQIADDAVIGDVENRRFGVFVDGDDRSGVFHSDDVLNRAGNAESDINFRRDGLPA
jgi:hypothetical protein